MNGKTITILVLAAVLAFVIGLNVQYAVDEHQQPQARPYVVTIEEMSADDAQAFLHENKPSRDLSIWRFLDYRWWRDDALTALTSMEGMKGNGAEVGGFEQLVQKKFTAPVIMVVAGIGVLLAAAGYGIIRKDLKVPVMVAVFVAAPLIVGGVAFQAWPPLAPILFVVAIIAGIIYFLTQTNAGRKILEGFTRKSQALVDVVKAIETVDQGRKFAGVKDDDSETKAIKRAVASASVVNGGVTSAEVKKITG